MNVSILIISFNTRELTTACVRSVLEHTSGVDFEIIVVDNASTDGSADAIEQIARAEERLAVIRLSENIGFAPANNVAARAARGDRLLLLNPDTLLQSDAVSALVRFADERPENGIWGGRTLFEDGSLNPTSCWARSTPWSMFSRGVGLAALFRGVSFFNPEPMPGWRRNTVREVDIVTGCFLLIDRSLWDRLGGFDERFFLFGEEVDLCVRARALGARPLFTPSAEIIHYGGRSSAGSVEQTIRQFRAKNQLFRKRWRPAAAWFAGAMIDAWAFRRMALGRLIKALGLSDPRADDWIELWRSRREWRAALPPPERTPSRTVESRTMEATHVEA